MDTSHSSTTPVNTRSPWCSARKPVHFSGFTALPASQPHRIQKLSQGTPAVYSIRQASGSGRTQLLPAASVI